MSEDLVKWADDPKALDELVAALHDARNDLPSEAQVTALATRLGPLLGGGGGGGGGGGSGGGSGLTTGKVAATGIATGTKLIVGLVSSAVLIAGIATWMVVTERAAVERRANADTETTGDGALGAPASSAREETSEAPVAPTPPETPSSATEEGAPLGMGARTIVNRPPEDEVPEPRSELTLLQAAQDALRSSPAEALALADRHARSYPGGALAQEREVVAVDALLRLGRRPAAQARARRFRDAHPGSSQLRRLEQLLGRE